MSINVTSGERHPFQIAVESKDLDAVQATLRTDVSFYTPLRFEPFRGRDAAIAALTVAARSFAFQPGFRYTHTLRAGSTLALFFEADLQGKHLEGVDLVVLDEQDKVAELRVMMRPFTTVRDLVAVTRATLDAAQHGAPQPG
jgi:SnoaL-like protein